ncbi:iron-siderophore ABC transporter substrate-binding protein [Corynebacterium sp. TAE3-ERU12]|uniref:iron-siderophore ABC transporter substrate-binding protein n=1 Tax=Corynebacterium sp. TAE3-ERU12 TaxID=2849491 RepID=UPI00351D95E2
MQVGTDRRKGLKSLFATAVAATLVLTGCSKGGADDTSAVDDASNGDVAVERVAAVGMGDGDTLMALGIKPVTVSAWGQEGDVDESGVGPWARELLGDAKPTVIYGAGTGFTPEILEKIASTDPDHIIAVNAAVDEQAEDSLNKIAPTTLKPEGFEDWQVPWEDQVEQISEAVGKEQEGDKLIEETKSAFEKFRKEHSELQGETAAVVMPYDGKIGIYTSGDGRGAFIESLGFEIPEEIEGDGESFYRDVAPENYDIFNNVDHLFVLDYQGAVDELKKEPTFTNLDVVKDGRVKYISEDVGNAMSMPNPVTIPWAIGKINDSL